MRKREADEPRLFDLPLVPEEEETEPEPAAEARGTEDGPLPLFPEDVEPGSADAPKSEPRPRPARAPASAPPSETAPPAAAPPTRGPDLDAEPPPFRELREEAAPGPRLVPRRPVPAPFGVRLLAAFADLGVHAAAAGAGWLGAGLLGARVDIADLPAVAVFVLSFSFLYAVVSLAFWGRTPGMAAAGVVSRGPGDQPLTFGQTGLRWLAGVLTAALAGLPLLVALSGRSFADRLSGSTTLRYR